jgi:hypothetical protein
MPAPGDVRVIDRKKAEGRDMTPQELQTVGDITGIAILATFAFIFVLVMRYERRRIAKRRTDLMREQRELAGLCAGTPGGVVAAFMLTGADVDTGGFRQHGAMQVDDAVSDGGFMDQSPWIDTSDWSSMNPCAIGGPGPGNNFGHSAGLSHDGWSDH